MAEYYKRLFYIDVKKINVAKGTVQFILMLIPLLIFYIFDSIGSGLLFSIGTLSNIYVFNGTKRSKIKTIVVSTIGLALAMILGSLTAESMLLFGILLFCFATIPYYVCNTLSIKGPSSTFFIVAYGLGSIMPYQPELALYRGILVISGGILTVIIIAMIDEFYGNRYIDDLVAEDYNSILKLMRSFNNDDFETINEHVMRSLMTTSDALSSVKPAITQQQPEYERTLLLHQLAEGIYAEVLDVKAKGIEQLSEDLMNMMDKIVSMVKEREYPQSGWTRNFRIDESFNHIAALIYKTEEILFAPTKHIEIRTLNTRPHFITRLIRNITPESNAFVISIKYAVIMALAITIALVFHIDRPYWIALTVHSVLVGNTTLLSLERATSRFVGTLIGIAVVALILWLNPDTIWILILIAITAGINEMLVASNYTFAMISITTQVLLMSGIAVGHLSISFAYLRITDVVIGVLIAVVGVTIIGRKSASNKLPEVVATLLRIQASTFYYLYASNHKIKDPRNEMFKLYLNLSNVKMTYSNAYGEFSANKQVLKNYYLIIFLTEQITFLLNRQLRDGHTKCIDNEVLGHYLLAFERVAQQLEKGILFPSLTLESIDGAHQLQQLLSELQQIKLLK
ncbi:Inner membrane protein YccS [Macrococcoides canis]|uniref:Inner membrane protein YccS n=1 Tax=Macrococcoides canis TaxID=1855823 RepID=A0A1W7A8D3_9STAP|nr:FUSC family protein [Macrococcus canis]ARQ05877.1 Inner membrane protein YccS [Macrococcus canis]